VQLDGRIDLLTGAASRAALVEHLDEVADGDEPTLIIVDLDGFTWVNDTLGYRVGDGVLCAIARRFREDAELDASMVARTGDDEFGIVLRCSVEQVHDRSLRAIALAEIPFDIDGDIVRLSASVGVTASPAPQGAAGTDVIHWAVRACHLARDRGGGRYAVYSLAMSPSHRATLLVDHLAAVTKPLLE
jgi:diguanylate cyclase (GGDEF)-like protein